MKRLALAPLTLALLALANPAAAVTYDVVFDILGGLPAPTGTISFAAPLGVTPQSHTGYSFSFGTSLWAPPDDEPSPLLGFTSSGTPRLQGTVRDTAAPFATMLEFNFNPNGTWDSDIQAGGYSLVLVPEPATALLLATGLTALAVRRRSLT